MAKSAPGVEARQREVEARDLCTSAAQGVNDEVSIASMLIEVDENVRIRA